ncbi:MAG: sensor domain-containing diguanylate cyclase [Lachnospiraceae bacterium]|nr:sensor domain-containing diguanylate cyclase [Lachnospiraceae bacterium]
MDLGKKRMTASFSSEYCCRYDSCLTMKTGLAECAYMLGYSEEETELFGENSFLNMIVEESREEWHEELCRQIDKKGQAELIFQACRKDGRKMWIMNRGCLIKEEDGQEYIHGVLVDITWSKKQYDKEKEEEQALHEQLGKDSLTSIYNATTTRKLAEEYFEETGPDGRCALLIIDLDDFKKVNDQKGHMFGDAVLIQAAKVIRKLFRSNDIVGRIGGDEFLVLMKDVTDKEIVKKRCQQLNEILKTVFEEEQFSDIAPTCSIGVGFSPDHGDSYFTLFCCADQALYQAKEAGRQQYIFYEEENCGKARGKDAMQYEGYDMNLLRGYLE